MTSTNAADGSAPVETRTHFPPDPPRVRGRAHVTFIDGAPGSGKTYRIREYAKHERDAYGTTLDESLFLTFTNAATENARAALRKEVFPDATMPEDVDRDEKSDMERHVRTLHSAALAAVQSAGVLVLEQGTVDPHDRTGDGLFLITRGGDGRNADAAAYYYRRFFADHFPMLDYDHDAEDPMGDTGHGLDEAAGGLPTGNQLLALADYCASQRWLPDRFTDAPLADELDVNTSLAREVLEAWPDYKREHNLIEHHDYVERAIRRRAVPSCSVVYVDEFQDFSPLEHDYYAAIRDHAADRAYIAGDPLQSIYGFRGGTPDLLRETVTDHHDPQDESWRCRQRILDAAAEVVTGPAEHGSPGVTARRSDDPGHVAHIDIQNPSDLGKAVQGALRHPNHGGTAPVSDRRPAVFLLARTNQQAQKIAVGLQNAGIPYHGIKRPGGHYGWSDPLPMLLEAFRALVEGRLWPVVVARGVLINLDDHPARTDAQAAARDDRLSSFIDPGIGGFLPEQYRAWLPEVEQIDGDREGKGPNDGVSRGAAKAVMRSLTLYERRRDLLSRALDHEVTHDPADVRVGTIHAAKGLEADCALVFPAYSHAQLDRYTADPETAAEERRVFYVGLTRAARSAYVVHDYFGGEEFPPLDPTATAADADLTGAYL